MALCIPRTISHLLLQFIENVTDCEDILNWYATHSNHVQFIGHFTLYCQVMFSAEDLSCQKLEL